MIKVLFGTTIGPTSKWLDRWLGCFSAFTYQDKLCAVSTDVPETCQYIRDNHPYVRLISFDTQLGLFNGQPNGLILMAEGKDRLRNYVCREPEIDWLLMADSDIECPPDTIERFLDLVQRGYDVVWTTNIGAVMFMHRDVCDSVHFWSATCYRNHRLHIEENFEVLRQIEHMNKHFNRSIYRVLPYRADWLRHQDRPLGVY